MYTIYPLQLSINEVIIIWFFVMVLQLHLTFIVFYIMEMCLSAHTHTCTHRMNHMYRTCILMREWYQSNVYGKSSQNCIRLTSWIGLTMVYIMS